MNINTGEKIHIAIRRNFDGDIRRHFVGEVVYADGPVVRLTGFSIVFDTSKNVYVWGKGVRTTIMNLAESGYIVNFIPEHVVISDLKYQHDSERRLVMTDGNSFSLDINEFGISR